MLGTHGDPMSQAQPGALLTPVVSPVPPVQLQLCKAKSPLTWMCPELSFLAGKQPLGKGSHKVLEKQGQGGSQDAKDWKKMRYQSWEKAQSLPLLLG